MYTLILPMKEKENTLETKTEKRYPLWHECSFIINKKKEKKY